MRPCGFLSGRKTASLTSLAFACPARFSSSCLFWRVTTLRASPMTKYFQVDPGEQHSFGLTTACAGSAASDIPGYTALRCLSEPQPALPAFLPAVPASTAQSRCRDHPGVSNGPGETHRIEV